MKLEDTTFRLSATDLANHLACRHLTGLDRGQAEGRWAQPDWFRPEAALLVRQARAEGQGFQLVSGDALDTEQFGLVAGEAAEGTIFSAFPDARHNPEAVEAVARFRAAGFEPEGLTLHYYASVQVWAQAAEKAGAFAGGELAAVLRREQFPTVLGRVGFDAKGDVTGVAGFAWFVWRGGRYEPLEESRTE